MKAELTFHERARLEKKVRELEGKIIYGIADIFNEESLTEGEKKDVKIMREAIKHCQHHPRKIPETNSFSRIQGVADYMDIVSNISDYNENIFAELAAIHLFELKDFSLDLNNVEEDRESDLIIDLVSEMEQNYAEECMYFGGVSFEQNIMDLIADSGGAANLAESAECGYWFYGCGNYSDLLERLEYLVDDSKSKDTLSIQIGNNQSVLFPDMLDINGMAGYGENSFLVFLPFYQENPQYQSQDKVKRIGS